MLLDRFTSVLADAIRAVDAASPIAVNKRSGAAFTGGIGPHSEEETFMMVIVKAKQLDPSWFLNIAFGVPYPVSPRQKCDLSVRTPAGALYIEGKLLRLKGDNGKPNDNVLMHILPPYQIHRSALTDCSKLERSGFRGLKAIAIIGYDYPDFPLFEAIEAFETLAAKSAALGARCESAFKGLVHPVHREGSVMAWMVGDRADA